jgi:hypothetical protein
MSEMQRLRLLQREEKCLRTGRFMPLLPKECDSLALLINLALALFYVSFGLSEFFDEPGAARVHRAAISARAF